MLCCSVCGDWYPHVGSDRLDICRDCWQANFAGAQPSLDPTAYVPAGPEARAALDAFLNSQHHLPPRQRSAMARLAAEWRRQEAEDTP
jgi:hypothetical protein